MLVNRLKTYARVSAVSKPTPAWQSSLNLPLGDSRLNLPQDGSGL